MKKIVITGGVGSGKSEVMRILEDNFNCRTLRADDVSRELVKPHHKCYYDIIEAFPDENVLEESSADTEPPLDIAKLTKRVFSDEDCRNKINAIVQPAIKQYVKDDIAVSDGKYDYYFLESALAIEGDLEEIFDEIWYIYADKDKRAERLYKERGYDDAKTEAMMASQLSDEEFRRHATRIIDNNGDTDELCRNICQYR